MISCPIPGRGTLEIQHIVCDVNGTLSVDGILLDGVKHRFEQLQDLVDLHLISADTHGTLSAIEKELGSCITSVKRLSVGGEAEQKSEYVEVLGAMNVAAIGQGTNDRLMLKTAAIGVSILSTEATAVETLLSADVVAPDILTALDLFLNPSRLKATLRQ